MDKKETVKQPTEEAIRESLIAISEQVPEWPKFNEDAKIAEPMIHDGDDKYRSELISISCSPPPDMKVLPLLPGQP